MLGVPTPQNRAAYKHEFGSGGHVNSVMIGATVVFRFCYIQRIYVAGSSGGDCSGKAELDDCRGLGSGCEAARLHTVLHFCVGAAEPRISAESQRYLTDCLISSFSVCSAHLFSFILPLSLSCILFLNSPSHGWSSNPSSISASAFPPPPRSALWVTCCPNVTFHP